MGPIQHDIVHSTAMVMVQHSPNIELTYHIWPSQMDYGFDTNDQFVTEVDPKMIHVML